jgi:hypothetical protein
MALKLANNAVSSLAAPITNTDLSLVLQTGGGAKFPVLGGGDWCPVTVVKTDGTLEIMRCTARTSDTLTVTRGQEGTTPLAFSANDRVEVRWTVAAANEFVLRTGGLGATMSGDIPMGGNKITGLATGTAGTDAVNKAQMNAGLIGGNWHVGLKGGSSSVNSVTLSFDAAALKNAAGDVVVVGSGGDKTVTFTTAGPAAGGRDQAGNFSGQWVYIYAIWNGTAVALIASVTTSGPTLPSGYTHWCLLCPIRIGGANAGVTTRYAGRSAIYPAAGAPVGSATINAGSAYALTNLSVYIPPIATAYDLLVNFNANSTAGGDYLISAYWRDDSTGNTYAHIYHSLKGSASGGVIHQSARKVPAVAGNYSLLTEPSVTWAGNTATFYSEGFEF